MSSGVKQAGHSRASSQTPGLQSDIDVANVKMSLNPFCEIAVEARGPALCTDAWLCLYRSCQGLLHRCAW